MLCTVAITIRVCRRRASPTQAFCSSSLNLVHFFNGMGQQLAVAGAKWSKWTDPASGMLQAGGPAEDHKMLPQGVKFFRFEIKPEYAHYKNDVVLEVKVVEG